MNPTLTNPVPTTLNGVNVISNPQSFQVPQIDPNSANNALNSAITGLAPQLSQAQTQQTNAETKTNNSNDTLLNLMTQLGGQTADTVNAENQAGLPQLNNELRDLKTLQSQQLAGYIDQINRNANTNPFGQETSGQSNSLANIQRQRGIDALLTSSLIQAKEGNIASAQATIDRAINAKYDPIKNSINVQNQIIKNNYENLTRADKKLADVKLEKNKLQEKQLDRQIEQDTAIQNMLIDASAFQAPLSVINNAKAIIAKGGTPAQVAQALGQYTGASAKAELLKAQIANEKAQTAKLDADTNKTKKETDQLGTPSGKPPTDAQVQNAGYADRIQQANTIIDAKADVLKNLTYADFKLIESNSQVANKLLSADKRQAAQAMRNFITAKLRKESGASISPTEFADARLQYFPALGDDDGTLANKKALRDLVLKNNILGAGSAYTAPVQSPTPAPNNPFSQALGGQTKIPGTSIISGVSTDGSFNFNIPKQ